MKKYLLTIPLLIAAKLLCAQNSSAEMAARMTVSQAQQYVTLTTNQQTALYNAAVRAGQTRDSVLKQYRGTNSFQSRLAAATRLRDSLFQSILGERKYGIYRDSLARQQEREEVRFQQKLHP